MAQKPMKIEGSQRIQRRPATGEEGAGGINRNLLIGLGVIAVLIVGVVAWSVFSSKGGSTNDIAAMELGRLAQLLDQGEYQKAIDGDPTIMINGKPMAGLRSIVDSYGGTEAGKAAALQLGDVYLALGKHADAAGAFEVAQGSDADLVKAAALAGLASVAEAEGNYANAAARYDEAATLYSNDEVQGELIRPLYLFAAARNYESASAKEEAIERYREIAVRYPSSEQNSVARFALARFGVDI